MAAKKLPRFMTAVSAATPDPKRDRKVMELRGRAPPAVAGEAHSRGEGRPFQVVMPPETLRELKQAALDQDSSVRAVILEALKKAGFTVPAVELVDRRRPR